MPTKGKLVRYSMQDYVNRDYVQSNLADVYFDTMNQGMEGDFLFCTGCLDALDVLPAGSMKHVAGNFYDASATYRGLMAVEVDAKNAFMIAIANKEFTSLGEVNFEMSKPIPLAKECMP